MTSNELDDLIISLFLKYEGVEPEKDTITAMKWIIRECIEQVTPDKKMVDHMISPDEYDWYVEQNTKELLGEFK